MSSEVYCEIEGCVNRPSFRCKLEWIHKCQDKTCEGNGKASECINFPFMFCKAHLPSADTLIGTPLFQEAMNKLRVERGWIPNSREMRLRIFNMFEESEHLH